MDRLSKFMIDLCGTPAEKTAAQHVPVVEPTEYEKRAYARALSDSGLDSDFLTQFEGTPLYPQAIALAEQELATESRHLQARMARSAQRQADNWDQECNENDALRLQKAQLVLQLHKMKVMGVGAPTPPGQAVIGEPQPGPDVMGPEAGAPVEEPKLAMIRKKAAMMRKAAAAKIADVREDAPQLAPEFLPFGSTYVGLRRGQMTGRGMQGALRGLVGGTTGATLGGALGALPGQILTAGTDAEAPLTVVGALMGALGGGAYGTHLLTRGMIPEGKRKKELKPAKEG